VTPSFAPLACLVSSAPEMQRWWRCHEMTESQRHRNWPSRSASAAANGAPAQSGNEPTPAPQPAATEKVRQPAPAAPESAANREAGAGHVRGPMPKILCRPSKLWNNQFTAGVRGCSIKCPHRAFTHLPGSRKAARARDIHRLRLLFGNLWISPRRLMTAAPRSARSIGYMNTMSRMSCVAAEGRHA
jgi:hypothetical protein